MRIRKSNDLRIFNLHTDGIPYLSVDMLDRLGVPNLYTTRFISYDEASGRGKTGLRLAVMKNESIDEAAPVVWGNRDALAKQLGSSIEMECITDQKHTSHVLVASADDLGPLSYADVPERRKSVDGIITDMPGVLITAFGGDCPPVYLADPERKAVGLVHAGWRGTLSRIPEEAVRGMIGNFGCDPEDIYAAIGPGICVDCYEMGDEVYEEFASEWSRKEADLILKKYPAVDADGSVIRGGKYHLDLREANRLTLIRAGVREDRISVSNVCTRCNADIFYSYRARRMENEQAAMIVNRFDVSAGGCV